MILGSGRPSSVQRRWRASGLPTRGCSFWWHWDSRRPRSRRRCSCRRPRSGPAGAPGPGSWDSRSSALWRSWGSGRAAARRAGSGCRWRTPPWQRPRPPPSCSGSPDTRARARMGPMANDRIVIRGAREHNLKSIDLEIPRDQLVVLTGLSGSGKSSLAFDTIYAEGQRRYVESLSAYARQFLEQMEKPDVDSIEGLSPAISIEQKTTSKNPRSTVGTVTEIYDYLRVLFARIGVPHCPSLRRRDLRADGPADGRSRHGAAPGQPSHRAGAGRAGAQGRVPQALLRPAPAGLCPGARQRPVPRAQRGDRARQDQEAHDRGGRGPPGRPRHARRQAQRLARDRAPPGRGRGPGRGGGRPVLRLLGAAGLRGVRHLLPGGVAAHVLVQQSVRRLPRVRRNRLAVRDRPGPRGAEPQPVAEGRGARPLGRPGSLHLQADAQRARPPLQVRSRDAVGQAAEEDAGHHPARRGRRRLRGRGEDPRAPLQGDAVPRGATGSRALHGAQGLPRLPGLPPPARDARRQDRGALHRGRRPVLDQVRAPVLRHPDAVRAGRRRSRAACSRRSASGWASCPTSGSTT